MPAKSTPAPRTSRLKVFRTQIGFHNWLVAAPSQKAALEAWDVRENLFAMGSAEVVTDPASVELAMKTPGVPVRVETGQDMSKVARVLRLDDHRKHPKHARSPQATPPPRKKPPPKPKADRSKLDRAEEALREFRKRAVRERSAILRERRALDLKAEALEEDLDAEEERLEEAVEDARERYEAESD